MAENAMGYSQTDAFVLGVIAIFLLFFATAKVLNYKSRKAVLATLRDNAD